MIETIVQVDGMMCGMCESHINDAVRSHFQVKKVSSSHTKGQTVIQSQEPLDREQLAELQQATEGWMAAVYLHLQALADRGTAPAETADIYDMFTAAMLRPLPPRRQNHRPQFPRSSDR